MFHSLSVYRSGFMHHFTRVYMYEIIPRQGAHRVRSWEKVLVLLSGKWWGKKERAVDIVLFYIVNLPHNTMLNFCIATAAGNRAQVKSQCCTIWKDFLWQVLCNGHTNNLLLECFQIKLKMKILMHVLCLINYKWLIHYLFFVFFKGLPNPS